MKYGRRKKHYKSNFSVKENMMPVRGAIITANSLGKMDIRNITAMPIQTQRNTKVKKMKSKAYSFKLL